MKNFDKWHNLKKYLDSFEKDKIVRFNDCEVWWCSVGVNVGYEIFGKDERFVRPVMIIRKYSPSTFFGLPMSSKRKPIDSYYPFSFQGEDGSVLLDQGRVFDARRLVRRMGRANKKDVRKIKTAFINYLG